MCLRTSVFYYSFVEISEVRIITGTAAILLCIERMTNFVLLWLFHFVWIQVHILRVNARTICPSKLLLLCGGQIELKCHSQRMYLFKFNWLKVIKHTISIFEVFDSLQNYINWYDLEKMGMGHWKC